MDHPELIKTIKTIGRQRLSEKLFPPKVKNAKDDEKKSGGVDPIIVNPSINIQGNQPR